MLRLLLFLFLFYPSLLFADIYKYNPYTSKPDNIGSFQFSLFPDCNGTGKAISFTAASNTFTCNTISSGAATASGGINAVQYNGDGTAMAGKENVFSMNGTNVGIGTTNGRALLELTTGNFYVNGGNVGIGSLSPGTKLDVFGSMRILNSGHLTVEGVTSTGATGTGKFVFDASPTITGHETIEGVTATGATGTGKFVFDTSPTFVTPLLGTPTSGTLTNATGLPEGGLSLTDITTNNASTSRHGFLLKLDNNAAHYMDGTGAWTTPAGGSGTINSGTVNREAYYSGATTLDSSTKIFNDNTNVGIGTIAPRTSVEIGVQTMNINGSNVGIGSITPGQVLDVNGAGRFSGSGNSFLNSTSGNVGVGTTLSLNKLDVAGAISVGTTNAGYFTAPANGMLIQGNVGIGSTAPQSALTLGGNAHLGSTGTAPTVASNDCGSTAQGTVVAGSTDLRGSVTVGTLTVTSCAVTFNVPFGKAPVCLTQDDTTILSVKNSQTTTKLTITSTTSMSSDVVAWVCVE